ncbi:insulinase family protein [Phytohabitans sp. LJ34]|uniref:insulinase family protein n=1 Tax=Phytohabitans sp. LJ34 TaxID=3452217 RepID=UPI003F8ACCE9
MIRETSVDGVQTLLAPKSGPLMAGLTFRVGRADETLATAGVTHLLEHLALFHLGLSDYHYNGATGSVVTHFHMEGSEEDVVRYLAGVCDALGNLPVGRLETEKDILRTEAAGRSVGVADSMPLWRYGAQGYGLVSYDEMGLYRLSTDDVRRWAATWFTRQNAVLWITSAQVPAGLRLRLPEGVRRPVPRPSSALPTTPAYFNERVNGVVFDTVVRRRMAASMFSAVLEREMYRSLRQEGGYSYVTSTNYEPRGDGFCTVTALADALPDKQDAVLGGFVDVLARLRVGRIEQSDLDSVRAKVEEMLRHEDYGWARLPTAAMNALTGYPNPAVEALVDEVRGVTVDDITAVAVEATGAALLQVPAGLNARWAGYTPAPTSSTAALAGQRYASRQSDDIALVVGAEGVSVVHADGVAAVRYAECAIAVAWPDGGRQLIGLDGVSVRVEPTLYHLPPGLIAHIDASVPPANVVWMPARDPGAIPQPPAPAAPPPAVPAKRPAQWSPGAVVLLVLATITAALTALCGAAVASADPQNPDDAILRDPVAYAMLGCTLVTTIAFVLGAAFVWRRHKAALQ